MEVVKQWLKFTWDGPGCNEGLEAHWALLRPLERLGSIAAGRVRGPITATVQALARAGFSWSEPDVWTALDGEQLRFTELPQAYVLKRIRRGAEAYFWRRGGPGSR